MVNRVTKNLISQAGSLLGLVFACLVILFIGSFIGLVILEIIWLSLDPHSLNGDDSSYSADILSPGSGNKLAYEFALKLAIGSLPIILICLLAHILMQSKSRFRSCIGKIHLTDFIGWFSLAVILVFLSIGAIILFSASELGQHSRTAPYYRMAGPFFALAIAWSLQAMSEEFLFRGLLLPALSCRIGIRGAILFNAGFFSLLHTGNAAVSLLMLANIGIFGVLACLLTLYTGRIWAAVGLHAGWNFAQDYLAGIPVSGSGLRDHPSLFRLAPDGPGWITGGVMGLEGSILTTAIFIIFLMIYLFKIRIGHLKTIDKTGT